MPAFWPGGDRRKDGVSSEQASARNVGTCRPGGAGRVLDRLVEGVPQAAESARALVPVRVLGVPIVANRVAQMVVRIYLEARVEPISHPDSYGYRPGKSALDAVGTCRQQCWRSDWVIALDIQKFFDTVPHDLVEMAVAHDISPDQLWILLAWIVDRPVSAPRSAHHGQVVLDQRCVVCVQRLRCGHHGACNACASIASTTRRIRRRASRWLNTGRCGWIRSSGIVGQGREEAR